MLTAWHGSATPGKAITLTHTLSQSTQARRRTTFPGRMWIGLNERRVVPLVRARRSVFRPSGASAALTVLPGTRRKPNHSHHQSDRCDLDRRPTCHQDCPVQPIERVSGEMQRQQKGDDDLEPDPPQIDVAADQRTAKASHQGRRRQCHIWIVAKDRADEGDKCHADPRQRHRRPSIMDHPLGRPEADRESRSRCDGGRHSSAGAHTAHKQEGQPWHRQQSTMRVESEYILELRHQSVAPSCRTLLS